VNARRTSTTTTGPTASAASRAGTNRAPLTGAILDDEAPFQGGHDNKTARTVAVHEGQPINAAALSAMFRQIVADNRAGGWRKLTNTA
jgi:hypothetical protein